MMLHQVTNLLISKFDFFHLVIVLIPIFKLNLFTNIVANRYNFIAIKLTLQ